MTDLSAMPWGSSVSSFQYDNTRGLLYFTTSYGAFEVWNPLTKTIVNSLTIGNSVGSLALTADGRYAILGETYTSGYPTSSDMVDRIDLSTLTNQRLTLIAQPNTANGIANIAIGQSGEALFSGSPYYYYYYNPTYQIQQFSSESATLQSQFISPSVLASSGGQQIISDPGTDFFLIKQSVGSNEALQLFDPVNGYSVTTQFTNNNSYSDLSSIDAFSAAGILVDLSSSGLHVYDFNLHQIADLTPQLASASAAVFTPDGRELLLASGSNVYAFDTQTWTEVGALPIPGASPYGNQFKMTMSGDGRFLFVSEANALQQIDLTAQLKLTVKGDGVHTHLTGSVYNDTLIGTAASETLDGGAGNNTASYAAATGGVTVSLALQGSAQNTGSGGVDTLINIENLIGSPYADHLTGDAANNTLDGGGGNDVLDGGGGLNTVSFASAAQGVNVSLALQGSAQNIGANTVTLSNFQNIIGSALNDTLEGDGGNNVLDGGGGINTLSYAHAAAGVTVSLALQGQAQNTVGSGSDTLSNFQNILGSAYADHLTGDTNNNVIDGGGGDDVLNGGGGTDTVSFASATTGVTVNLALQGTGGAQNTGAGNVTLWNFQNIVGSAFADHLTGDANDNVIDGGGGDDVLDGGGGTDTVSFASAHTGVTVSLMLQGQAQATGVGSVTLSNFENVTGSAFNDIIEGNGGSNVLNGGGGVNTVSFAHATSGVSVFLDSHQAQVGQNSNWETLQNFQNVTGSAFNDTITGDSGANILDGGGGNNTVSYNSATAGVTVSLALQGQAQNTIGAGVDTLFNFQNLSGSNYNDVLTSGTGTSSLTGWNGADIFRIAAGATNATITDFSQFQHDGIDLSAYAQFSSFAAIQAAAHQSGSDTIINLGSGTLTLKNTTASNLAPRDFGFVSVPVTMPLPPSSTYSSVCFITAYLAGSSYWGSGVIIGPHTILTAAHMVWDQDSGKSASSVTVSPNFGSPFSSFGGSSTAIHYNPVDDSGGKLRQSQSQNDFAVIEVSQNLAAQGWWGIDSDFTGGVGGIAGYPATIHPKQQDITSILSTDSNYSLISYGPEFLVSPGSSGGPIWIDQGTASNPRPNVVGVVSTSEWGPLITAADLAQIQGWIAQDAHLWATRGDLTGLGVSDLVFRNLATGDWGYLGPKGSSAEPWHDLGLSSSAYTVIGTGSFTGDGVSEVAFRNNASGDYGYMTVSGAGAAWQGLGWSSPAYVAVGVGDFNGDGVADVAFRNNATGDFGYMAVKNGAAAWHDLGWSSPDYSAIAVGKFTDLKTVDIAFRSNLTGDWGYMAIVNDVAGWHDVGIWNAALAPVGVGAFNGSYDGIAVRNPTTGDWGYLAVGYYGASFYDQGVLNPSYALLGIGDYNGDGSTDVAFRNSGTGEFGFMTPTTYGGPTWHPFAPTGASFLVDPSYAPISAAADLNADGVTDLTLRNPNTGNWAYMSVTGSGLTWQDGGWASADYAVIGEGDFDGSVPNEVAFRENATGDWGFMTPMASGTSTWHALGWSSPDYLAVGAGDFNGDGLTDIVFRSNVTGDYGFMTVRGGPAWHGLGWSSPAYKVVGVGDFNGDGLADVAFRNATTGDWGYMAISGGTAAWHGLGWSSPAYSAIGTGDFNGDGHVDMAFRDAAGGDWGFMTALGDQAAWHDLGWSSPNYTPFAAGDFNGDHITDMGFRGGPNGDYGYMAVDASGATAWTDLANATAYMSV